VSGCASRGLVDDGRPVLSLLRAGQARDANAVWSRQPLLLHKGFETEFVFRIDARGVFCALDPLRSLPPARFPLAAEDCNSARFGSNGFALVLQSAAEGDEALGCAGGGGGLWGDGEGCSDCISPALVLRLDTYLNLCVEQPMPEPDLRDTFPWNVSKVEPPSHGAAARAATPTLAWEEHNQLRLLRLTCPTPNVTTSVHSTTGVGGVGGPGIGVGAAAADTAAVAPQMAMHTLLSSWGTTSLDDGRQHMVGVRFVPPALQVRLDYEVVMQTDRFLPPNHKQRDDEEGQQQVWEQQTSCAFRQACGVGPIVEELAASGNKARTVRTPAVRVLDSMGRARLSFTAGRTTQGLEQYKLHEWWVRRNAETVSRWHHGRRQRLDTAAG